MSTSTSRMTVEEFLALPDDPSVRRELIYGELREETVTTRNPRHAGCVTKIATALENWQIAAKIRNVYIGTGDVRCRLPNADHTLVGIDVGVFIGDEVIHQASEDSLLTIAPVVAVEVLSSTDTHQSVREKIKLYLAAGVAQVWIADPDFHVISVYRSDRQPQSRNSDEILTGDPELSGFSVNVASLFVR
ncbi:MAG TPA: Uma2 family endonuclease [Planctomycetaceae bacterium]|nr:Uma2 family endonuclease [Planctomycetaceae bacterium]HQZ66165.1 Uma2 family endonuclease [Planctomycetaceae bacterium]